MNVCEQRGSLSISRKGSLNRSRIRIYFRFGPTRHLPFSLVGSPSLQSQAIELMENAKTCDLREFGLSFLIINSFVFQHLSYLNFCYFASVQEDRERGEGNFLN